MHLGKPLGAIRRAARKKAVNVLKTYEMDGEKCRRYAPAKRFVLTGRSNGIKISTCDGFKVLSDPGHIRALRSAVLIRYPSMNRRCVGVSGLICRCRFEGVMRYG